jgi:hypothetical protein
MPAAAEKRPARPMNAWKFQFINKLAFSPCCAKTAESLRAPAAKQGQDGRLNTEQVKIAVIASEAKQSSALDWQAIWIAASLRSSQ